MTKELGLKQALHEVLAPDYTSIIQDASAGLVKAIQNDTVTVEQINSFLQETLRLLPESKQPRAHVFLLSKKAWLVSQEGKLEEALQLCDEALKIEETPSTWASKGMALLQLERLDEAFEAFRHSYSLRGEFGARKQAHLENLLGVWSVGALLRGLSGILDQDVREAEQGVFEYIELLNKAKEDNLQHMVLKLEAEQPVPEEIKSALEELVVMVRLLAIEDPFERWREFTKEISEVWPQGVSAVDAIREQRN